ncbi:MAG: hypothetical protein GY841_00335 [FCB group bacterium]|nr:hypothetical protein [FCB group bacterium]
MNIKSKQEQVIKRTFELLILFLIVIGLGALLLSLILRGRIDPQWLEILQATGLTFFPAGVVSFMLSRFAGGITEVLIQQVIDDTIKDGLKSQVHDITSEVSTQLNGGMKLIHDRTDKSLNLIHSEVSEGMKEINKKMESLSPLLVSCYKLGVQSVYLTRAEALLGLAWFLDSEINRAHEDQSARIWIVSSSIKGFLTIVMSGFDGRKMMGRIAQSGCDLRIIMTDPAKADFRAEQEGKGSGEIPNEIQMYLADLKRMGVKREQIKFYPGTPTVFGIATSDRMLLNPYPYETEAYRCFSMIVYKTIDPQSDIYTQYLENHFDLPWLRAKELALNDWEKLG